MTPVHNSAGTLAETIESIRDQTLPDWEAWLVDDGSTDGSWQLMCAYARLDPRIRLLRHQRQRGAAAARNSAIRAANGRYIAFLDADDLWRPEKLERQIGVLEHGAGFVFSSYVRRHGAGRAKRVVPARPQVGYRDALKGNPIGCLTAIYDTERYGKVEMPDLARRQDYALWLTLLKRGEPAVGLPEVLGEYRVRRASLSSNKLLAAQATWTVLRRHEGLPLPDAMSCFSAYVFRALRQRA